MFGYVERMENDRISKKVYVWECVDSRSVGRLWQRWIDAVKEYLKKRGLDIRQARKIIQDRSEWRGFVRKYNACGVTQETNP